MKSKWFIFIIICGLIISYLLYNPKIIRKYSTQNAEETINITPMNNSIISKKNIPSSNNAEKTRFNRMSNYRKRIAKVDKIWKVKLHSEYITTLKKNKFKQAGQEFYFPKNIDIIPISELPGNQGVIKKIGGFAFVQKSGDLKSSMQNLVVYNGDTKKLGYLTGKIMINTKNVHDIDEISGSYPINFETKYDHLKLGIFNIEENNSNSVIKVFNEIKKNDLVTKAKLEIISSAINLR